MASTDRQGEFGFGQPEAAPTRNLLPRDGEVWYHGPVFSAEVADLYLDSLLADVPWEHDEVVIFGKRIVTARQMAWFGDRDFDYRYSGTTHTAQVWSPLLREIKVFVEKLAQSTYNSCLLNRYEDGTQGMGWHSDDEKEMAAGASIASVSLGAERRFDFRHRESREKVSVPLAHGSLLVMAGATQTYWQHQIPKSVKVKQPRVNLTFRQITESK